MLPFGGRLLSAESHTELQPMLQASLANVSSATTYAAQVPTLTQPTPGAAQIILNGPEKNHLAICPIFASACVSPSLRVTGFSRSRVETNGAFGLWVPRLLWEGNVTLGSTNFTIGTPTLTTARQAITLETVHGKALLYQATNASSLAWLVVDGMGCEKIVLDFKVASGNSTNQCNAFIGQLP